MTELIEEHGADVEAPVVDGDPEKVITAGCTILHMAMYFCGKDAVNTLLDYGADPLARDANGFTPIMIAACTDNYPALEAALRHARLGGDRPVPPHLVEMSKAHRCYTRTEVLNHRNNWSNTPLNIAGYMGATRCLSVLIEAGSDLTACNAFDDNTLNLACMSRTMREKDLVHLLKHVINATGVATIDRKTKWSNYNVAGMVVKYYVWFAYCIYGKNASAMVQDMQAASGKTPLHCAAGAGNLAIVRALLKAGANPTLEDASGWKPSEKARVNGFVLLNDFLIENELLWKEKHSAQN